MLCSLAWRSLGRFCACRRFLGARRGDRAARQEFAMGIAARFACASARCACAREFEHRQYVEGRQFQDVQTRGPFQSWVHTHSFTPDGPEACRLEDRIDYELPFGFLGKWFGARMVEEKLEKLSSTGLTAQVMKSRVYTLQSLPPAGTPAVRCYQRSAIMKMRRKGKSVCHRLFRIRAGDFLRIGIHELLGFALASASACK